MKTLIKEALIKAVGIVSDPRKSFAAAAKLTEWVVKRFNQRFLKGIAIVSAPEKSSLS